MNLYRLNALPLRRSHRVFLFALSRYIDNGRVVTPGGRPATVNDITRMVGVCRATCSRVLGELAQMGVLTVDVDGREKHYRLRPEYVM